MIMIEDIKGVLEGGVVAMIIGVSTAFPSYMLNDVSQKGGDYTYNSFFFLYSSLLSDQGKIKSE